MNDLIVDANSLFARCWYAKQEQPRPTLDLYVYTVLQFLDRQRGRLGIPIDRMLFAWDGLAKTHKNRKEKPDEYDQTRRYLKQSLLDFFGAPNALHPDYEADDIVATAAFNSKAETIIVVSGDKDLMQLQGGNVLFYCLHNKAILPTRMICHKFGIKRPSQVAIAQAIIGDRSDGISGIPKWGPKKLEQLFEKVTEDMSFSQALGAIQKQIPGHLRDIFMESLDKTLLHTEVEGVPEPAPMRFCTTEYVEEAGFDDVARFYELVASQYDEEPAQSTLVRDSVAANRRLTGG